MDEQNQCEHAEIADGSGRIDNLDFEVPITHDDGHMSIVVED